jgi:metallophosphoesterase (TIGR00282 family)
MKVLALGDVTDGRAAAYVAANLPRFRRENKIDFAIVNAENAGFIIGPEPDVAKALLDGGADVLTGGNHTLQRKSLHATLEDSERMLRPANYPAEVPGMGYTILDVRGYRLLVMNAIGQVHMDPVDCPFRTIDRILSREEGNFDLSILDFHADASSEKRAMGLYLDGRVDMVFGTHTHTPTADEQILPRGTGFISDIGMCGPKDSILGIDPETVFARMVYKLPDRWTPAAGEIRAEGVVFTLDDNDHRVTAVERVSF